VLLSVMVFDALKHRQVIIGSAIGIVRHPGLYVNAPPGSCSAFLRTGRNDSAYTFQVLVDHAPKRRFPLILRVDGAVASWFNGTVVVQPKRGALSISDDYV
jgi:hypothetical protein